MNTSFSGNLINLRPFEPDDVSALQSYLNQPGLAGRRYIPDAFPQDLPLSLKQAEAIYEQWSENKEAVTLAVVEKTSQKVIGHITYELTWDAHRGFICLVIAPENQGKGYGSEAFQIALDYIYASTPAHNLNCWVASWNEPGRVFMKHLGFTESGCSRRSGLRDGKYYDMVIYDILRQEWRAGTRR